MAEQNLANFLRSLELAGKSEDNLPVSNQPAIIQQVTAQSPRRLARRSGVLAGKLAAGVFDLLASNPEAPVELRLLAGKSVNNLLASNSGAIDELEQLAGKSILLASKLSSPLAGKLRSGRISKELRGALAREGGLARAANISPERRREIALLGVEARRKKRTP